MLTLAVSHKIQFFHVKYLLKNQTKRISYWETFCCNTSIINNLRAYSFDEKATIKERLFNKKPFSSTLLIYSLIVKWLSINEKKNIDKSKATKKGMNFIQSWTLFFIMWVFIHFLEIYTKAYTESYWYEYKKEGVIYDVSEIGKGRN